MIPRGDRLTQFHDEANTAWHSTPVGASAPDVSGTTVLDQDASAPESVTTIILAQHRANFDLWHREDEARDPDAPDARIAAVKRAIDQLNQRRNDLVESLDTILFSHLSPAPEAPLHSETPGMIVDRLSILSLKVFHSREEAARLTATDAHRERNRHRLAILLTQRSDLSLCLDALHAELIRGTRRFQLYRQMKMYNDPDLNPVLYRRAGG